MYADGKQKKKKKGQTNYSLVFARKVEFYSLPGENRNTPQNIAENYSKKICENVCPITMLNQLEK